MVSYRGEDIKPLRGRYVFGDFIAPDLGRGRLFQLATPNAKPGGLDSSKIREPAVDGWDDSNVSVLGFAQDASGEIYMLANTTGVPFGDTRTIQEIVPGH